MLFNVFTIFALVGASMAGLATYSYNPYLTTYHAPAAYTLQHPIVYHHAAPAPVYAKASLVAPAPATVLTKAAVVAPASVVKTYAAPAVHALPVVKEVEFDSHPRYDFSYGVHDSVTGDIKNQVESRSGGNVAGSYSLIDADGYKRTVTYTADDLNGFNAVVQREPIGTLVAAATPVVPAAVSPVFEQNHQYLPQPVAPVQPDNQPNPVEYPEQGSQPSYPDPGHDVVDDDDTEIIDARSAKSSADQGQQASSTSSSSSQ